MKKTTDICVYFKKTSSLTKDVQGSTKTRKSYFVKEKNVIGFAYQAGISIRENEISAIKSSFRKYLELLEIKDSFTCKKSSSRLGNRIEFVFNSIKDDQLGLVIRKIIKDQIFLPVGIGVSKTFPATPQVLLFNDFSDGDATHISVDNTMKDVLYYIPLNKRKIIASQIYKLLKKYLPATKPQLKTGAVKIYIKKGDEDTVLKLLKNKFPTYESRKIDYFSES